MQITIVYAVCADHAGRLAEMKFKCIHNLLFIIHDYFMEVNSFTEFSERKFIKPICSGITIALTADTILSVKAAFNAYYPLKYAAYRSFIDFKRLYVL